MCELPDCVSEASAACRQCCCPAGPAFLLCELVLPVTASASPDQQAAKVWDSMIKLTRHLAATAIDMARNASTVGMPSSLELTVQLQERRRRLQEQAGALGSAGDSSGSAKPSSAHLSGLHQLMQPAAELTDLMQQYYALPAVAAEWQLSVAQAAADRSCAYLRCANLGGERGPAAGQGSGSMRCRWAGG